MRSPDTFAILFWVYSSRAKNHETKIYARITVNGKKVNISLKYKVDIRTWDAKRQRTKGNSEASRTLNMYLDRVYSHLVQCYQELTIQGELVTAELIKANYLGQGDNGKTLQELIDYHRTRTASTFAKGTIRNFGVTEGYLQKFLKKERRTTDVYLKQLDYRFVCDFEYFLHSYWPKGHPKALGHNTVMKHIQRLRKMVTLAYHSLASVIAKILRPPGSQRGSCYVRELATVQHINHHYFRWVLTGRFYFFFQNLYLVPPSSPSHKNRYQGGLLSNIPLLPDIRI